MFASNRWLLPEGIEEILPPRAMRMEGLRRQIIDLFDAWGYDLVMPPLIEYLESLLTGVGHDLDLKTFKLTDQLTGRLMGVRADMTPQVARIDAHHLKKQQVPVRLCYLGEVLHTRPGGFSRSRSPLQVGAEIYGHPGIESDLEVLQLMLETLAVVGVHDVHLDLGHVEIYRSLVRRTGLDPDREGELFDAMQRKAGDEVRSILNDHALDNDLRAMLLGLVDLNGGPEVLDAASELLAAAPAAVAAALSDLRSVAESLTHGLPDLPLHFDLAELRGYGYHTGVVFAAFIPAHGEPVGLGGRYDAVGGVFGRGRAATGFSTDLKTLMELGEPLVGTGAREGILAPWSQDRVLQAEVRTLRAAGERVLIALPGQVGGAVDLGCDRVLRRRGEQWRVESANDQ